MAAPQNFVSVSRRPPDVEDYIDILRRYRSWVVGPTFAGLVISVVIACWLPDTYRCTAAMQIKPGSVPASLLPAAITGAMQQRLQQLNLEILGRDSLIALIQNPKFDLYKKERARLPVEDIAEEMVRKHVGLSFVAGGDGGGAQAFRIFFEYPDKYKARGVVMELVAMFQNKNIQLQQSQATNVTSFMDDVVKQAREKMDKAQTAIATFSAENQGRLPDNYNTNSMDVQTRNTVLSGINDQIGNEVRSQTMLEAQLANIKNMEVTAEANLTQTQTTSNQTVRNSNLINIEQAISVKKMELDAALKTYRPDFPDVLVVKEQLKTLEDRRSQIEREEGAVTGQGGTTVTKVPNQQAQQQLAQLQQDEIRTRAQIRTSQQQVDMLRKRGEDISRQIRDSQEKLAASPVVFQKYKALEQDYNLAKDEYEKLSKTKGVSETQQSMEEHRAGETLEVLESPILPETPTSPIRSVIIGGGVILGLTLGIVLAAAKEIKNTSLKNLKDVRAYTNLPVLSSIPLLENALLVRRKRRLAWLAWSSAVIVGAILMCGAIYYHVTVGAQVT